MRFSVLALHLITRTAASSSFVLSVCLACLLRLLPPYLRSRCRMAYLFMATEPLDGQVVVS